jgi:hypothetical protein
MEPEREIQRGRECASNQQPGHGLRQCHGFDVGGMAPQNTIGTPGNVAVPQQKAQEGP